MSNQSNENRILSLAGLAQRAGLAASGEQEAEQAVRSGKARLVLLACDASGGTVKKFSHRCFYYNVPLARLSVGKKELGQAIGKGERSSLAICEEGFAKSILNLTEKIEL